MYDPDAPKTPEDLELIEVARRLADRLRAAEIDSAEEKMIRRQIKGLRSEGELGGLLAEEILISGHIA